MTQVKEKTAVERLKDDKEYYGEFGRQYLSNSDIKVLRENPKEYGVPREDNKAFAEGRYFHQSMLEPDKAEQTLSIGVASRNTKAYKEMLAAENKREKNWTSLQGSSITPLNALPRSWPDDCV